MFLESESIWCQLFETFESKSNLTFLTVICCISRYGKKCQDYENIEKQLLIAETRVSDLNARYLDEQKQRKHWEEEYNVS